MIKAAKAKVMGAPTPMAGLALGIASLGWCWENAAPFDGYAQWSGAAIASLLLAVLAVKTLCQIFHHLNFTQTLSLHFKAETGLTRLKSYRHWILVIFLEPIINKCRSISSLPTTKMMRSNGVGRQLTGLCV